MKNLNGMSDNFAKRQRLQEDKQIASERVEVERLKNTLLAQEEGYRARMEEREAEVNKMEPGSIRRMVGEKIYPIGHTPSPPLRG